MKISYVLQLEYLLIMIGIGFIIGIFYGVINIFNKIKKIYLLQICTDCFFCILFTSLLIISCNILNMGQLRLYLIFGYILGFTLERITLGKIFAKGYKYVYNKIVNLIKLFIKSKFGKVIFK